MTIEEIQKERRELEAQLTKLVNDFQDKCDIKGAYSEHGAGIRITHCERSMSGGKHSVYVSLSI
jgi:hypothetical protein